MLHGGERKLDELREVKEVMSLRELLEMKGLSASCTASGHPSVIARSHRRRGHPPYMEARLLRFARNDIEIREA